MGHRHVQNYLHLLHKTSWESCRSSDILCNIFPGKNRRQKWEICHSKEADLKLSVLISTLRTSWKHEKGRLSTICMQDRICLFFLTLVSVLLYCFMSQELHKKMTRYKSQGSFKSLWNTNTGTTSSQLLILLPLIPKKKNKHNKILWKL